LIDIRPPISSLKPNNNQRNPENKFINLLNIKEIFCICQYILTSDAEMLSLVEIIRLEK
jgi:hypothetical protein